MALCGDERRVGAGALNPAAHRTTWMLRVHFKIWIRDNHSWLSHSVRYIVSSVEHGKTCCHCSGQASLVEVLISNRFLFSGIRNLAS